LEKEQHPHRLGQAGECGCLGFIHDVVLFQIILARCPTPHHRRLDDPLSFETRDTLKILIATT
jgi:hypothetical protein